LTLRPTTTAAWPRPEIGSLLRLLSVSIAFICGWTICRISTPMLRMYASVEIPISFGSGNGEVSVSSPTCVLAKSPGAMVIEPAPL
jgi:hypothetical protein